jgi:MFS family permease
MFTLIRRNPAIRTLPKWLGISAVTATILINVLTLYVWQQREGTNPLLVVSIVWLAATIYLVFGEVRTRCTPFDMALPISARRVWLSHLTAVILSGVAILAVTAILTAGGVLLLWRLSGHWMVPVEGMGGLAVHACAGLILAVVLIQNPLPPVHQLRRNRARILLSILVMAAVLSVVVVMNRVSSWTALVTFAVAVTVGMYRYRLIPVTFSLSTADAATPIGLDRDVVRKEWEVAVAEDRARGAAFERFLNGTIFKCYTRLAKKKLTPWLTMPIVLFFGALISGLDRRWLEFSLTFNVVSMVVYMLIAFTAPTLKTMYIIDALPVSRKRLLNVLVLPFVVALAIGYWGGRAYFAVMESRSPSAINVIHFVQDNEDDNYYLYVPYDAMEILWGGRAPDTVAPWGESREGWAKPLFRGCPVKMYTPYHTPPGSSIDFAAWQISRAIEAVYGESVSPEEIKDRYLRKRDNGTATLIPKRLKIAEDYPRFRRITPSGPFFPLVFATVFVVWMLAMSVYFQAHRAGISNRKRTVVMWILLGIMMLWWISMFLGPAVRLLHTMRVNAFLTVLVVRAGTSAISTAAVWLGSIAMSMAAYLVALRRFEKVEATYEREQIS